MDNIAQYFEFPVTIPNQRSVDRMVTSFLIINVIGSISWGLYTGSLQKLYTMFFTSLLAVMVIAAPNWLFKKEPNLKWLEIKI
ncbi:hypothetical protein JA1_003962 [Spathaspora sp. JA1]|nr:hypothetical protein JA1_003962 [Spathaspora sp. JA1]